MGDVHGPHTREKEGVRPMGFERQASGNDGEADTEDDRAHRDG